MGTSKGFDPADNAVADVLAGKVAGSGISYRKIREETGISINRIGKILRKEPPPATVGEIGAIAQAIGMTASQIIGQAEHKIQKPDLHIAENLSEGLPTIDPVAMGLAASRDTRDEDTDFD